MDENKEVISENKATTTQEAAKEEPKKEDPGGAKIKTRQGSGYLKQLYSTARTTAGTTHSHLKNLTTFLVNFVPIEKVDASELQVRVHFDESEIAALSNSIKEHGVLQPILVVQDGDRYKVIAGERRLRAARVAGMDRIPARVLSTNDKATHEIALRENLDRVDLHPIEEGEGYLSLIEAQAYASHDAISKAFGKPKSRVTECIGFTRLPKSTKDELLRTGIKNRALLRQLLTVAPEKHLSLIAEASGKEDVLEVNSAGMATPPSTDAESTPKKTAAKPFEYRMDQRGISVPSFKWKRTQGKDSLRTYIESLRKLLAEVEPWI
jgi:ParB family chromosome partitioning protein